MRVNVLENDILIASLIERQRLINFLVLRKIIFIFIFIGKQLITSVLYELSHLDIPWDFSLNPTKNSCQLLKTYIQE